MQPERFVTCGLVLRETDTRDADKILTVLTPGRGKLAVIARGARRKGSRVAAACQLLAYSEMTLYERGQWTMLDAADTIELFDRQSTFLEESYGADVNVTVIDLPGLVEVSSTQLRQALANGGGREYLDPSIYGYILRKGLYGTYADMKKLSLPDLRAVSYSMIYSKRVPHVQGTEWEAAELAKRWGADVMDARKAAILHDCTKYWSLAKQLSKCAEYGILLDRVEQKTLPLLHSKTAAAVAERMFGMPQDICQAICWHTTGKADMTLLEKILYMADYAEPHRSWSEEAHGLAMQDLDAGVLLGLENTIKFTRAQGRQVHYRTIEARDWLRSQGVKLPDEP